MERFWRTLREGCLDHLGSLGSLHDVDVRLYTFLDQHYHRAPHASLMGRAPGAVFAAGERPPDDLDEQKLRDALTVRERRRVRADTTVSWDGQDWELDQGFLAGRVVTVGRSLLEGAQWVDRACRSTSWIPAPAAPRGRLPAHVLPQRDARPARLLPAALPRPWPLAQGDRRRGLLLRLHAEPGPGRRSRPRRRWTSASSRIETMPLERAGDAYARRRSGEARSRMV
jgi:hypothetical protein